MRKLHGQQPELSMSQLRNAGLTEFERDYGALIGSLDEQRQADVQVATQVNAQVTDNVGAADSVTESAAASATVLGDDNEPVDGHGDTVSFNTDIFDSLILSSNSSDSNNPINFNALDFDDLDFNILAATIRFFCVLFFKV